MLAHAFRIATAIGHNAHPAPDGLIELTINEFRGLFDALLLASQPAHRFNLGGLWLAIAPPDRK
jgi:hypothetical protein